MSNIPNEEEFYNSWPPYMDSPKPPKSKNPMHLKVFQRGICIFDEDIYSYNNTIYGNVTIGITFKQYTDKGLIDNELAGHDLVFIVRNI